MTLLCPLMILRRLLLLLCCLALPALADSAPDDDESPADTPPYRTRVLADGKELAFLGDIRTGAAAALELALIEHPEAKVLHLRSGGGLLTEAVKMAGLVKARELDTYVTYGCYSACTMVFAAGKHRVAYETAEFGFHRPGVKGVTKRDPDRESSTRAEMEKVGIPPSLLDRIYKTPFEQMWIPTLKELRRADFLTGTTRGSNTGYAPLPTMEPEEIDAMLQREPMYRLLQQHAPDIYDRLRSTALEDAGKAVTMRTFNRDMNLVLNQAIDRWLSRASDEDLAEYAQIRLEQMQPPAESTEPGCDLFGFGKKDGGLAILSNREDKREVRWMEHMLEHALPNPVVVGLRTEVALDNVIDTAAAEGKLDRKLLTKAGREAAPDKAAICKATASLYEAVLAQPEPQRFQLLRALFVE